MSAVSVVSIALGFAFAVAGGVYFAALTSGGHINPAITIAFMVTANIPITTVLTLILISLLWSRSHTLYLLTPTPRDSFTSSVSVWVRLLPQLYCLELYHEKVLYMALKYTRPTHTMLIVGRKVLYGANTLTMNRTIGDTGTAWSMPIGGAVLLEIATTFFLVSVVFAVARLRVGMHFLILV